MGNKIQKKRSSLKTILSFIIGLVFVILVSVLVFIAYIFEYNAVEKAYVNQLKNFNQEINRQVEDLYISNWQVIDYFVNDERFINSIKKKDYVSVSKMFRHYAFTWKGYENIFFSSFSEDPVILAAAKKNVVGIKWGFKGFTNNIESALIGKRYVSPATQLPLSLNNLQFPVFMFTAPVTINKKKVGILSITLDFSKYLQPIVKNVKIGDSGNTYILDHQRFQILAHRDEAQLLKMFTSTGWVEEIKKVLLKKSSEREEAIHYQQFGIKKILTFIENKKHGYITCSTIDENDIRSVAIESSKTMIVSGALVLVLGLVFVFIYIGRKLKLLVQLTDASLLLGQKKFDDGISNLNKIKWTKDEVGILGLNFKDMGINLQDALQKLEAKVDLANENLKRAHDDLKGKHELLQEKQALIERELEFAKNVQMRLLPEKPENFPLDMSQEMHIATSVGGDFYCLKYYKNKLSLAIGDVSGHGVPSALVMVLMRDAFMRFCDHKRYPEEVLLLMNRTAINEIEAGMFTTFFYCEIDLDTYKMTYCNAGHNNPVLFQGDKIYSLDSPGLILGVSPQAHYETRQVQLGKGDLLFLYTDGLSELHHKDTPAENYKPGNTKVEDPTQMLGINPVIKLLHRHSSERTEITTKLINKLIVEYGGEGPYADDITFVSVKF